MKPIDIIAIILVAAISLNYTVLIVGPLFTGIPRSKFQQKGLKEITIALINLLFAYMGYKFGVK